MNQLGKFNGVLLVSDFDDTLYGEDMRITRENVEALTYFTREGGTFTVATGRARPNFAPHASHIPINAPVILSNGSALYDFRTGEMIYETFLPDRVREDLQQMARRHLRLPAQRCHLPSPGAGGHDRPGGAHRGYPPALEQGHSPAGL